MRKYLFYKKWLGRGLFIVVTALPIECDAQSLKRQAISSYGSSGFTQNLWIGQTAGQSFHTGLGSNGMTASPGFQQPLFFAVKEIGGPVINNLNVLIYPNPASQSVTIISEKEIEQSVISVRDINGKYLLSEKVPNLLSHTVYCGSWANGAYVITISDSKRNMKTLRLIISN